MTDRPEDGEEQTFDSDFDQEMETQDEGAPAEDILSEEEEDSFFSGEEEAPAQDWEDELPPEDDFQDIGQEIDEEVEEEIIEDPAPEGAYEEVYEDELSDEGAKKRGKGVLFGVLAVAVVLVGGLAYLQFSSDLSGGNVPLAPVVDTRQPSARPADFAQPAAQPEATEETGETDLASLYQDAKKQTEKAANDLLPGGEIESSSAVPSVSSDIVTMDDADIQKEAKEASTKVAKVEEIPMPALQPSEKKEEAKQDAKPLPMPVTEPVAAASQIDMTAYDLRLKAMDRQIEALQSSLRQALDSNKELAKKVAKLESSKGASGADLVSAPENKKLLSKISQLEDMIKKQKTEMKKATKKAVKKAVVKKAAPKPAPKPAPKKVTRKPVKKTVTVKPSWVLRAATPEAAWVSKDKESTALRRVAVGETLPGLGKIQAIRQKGASWELIGSLGTLR